MKNLFVILVSLLAAFPAAAQAIDLTWWGAVAAGDAVPEVSDPDGNPCAVIRLETPLSGWTFEAGLDGVMDTRSGQGYIYVYVPAYARSITVSHPLWGAVRHWPFPETLSEGTVYSCVLSAGPPKVPEPPVRKGPSFREIVSAPEDSRFCQHFVDLYMGFPKDGDKRLGLSYTWVGGRLGPYVSAATDFCGGYSLFGGASWRVTDPELASLDWQLYGGLGTVDGHIGVDVGTRFGWTSEHRLSRWDFGVGCQLAPGMVMPTLSVGLFIWGIPLSVGLCLVIGAI